LFDLAFIDAAMTPVADGLLVACPKASDQARSAQPTQVDL
jgi:hypothetical protein